MIGSWVGLKRGVRLALSMALLVGGLTVLSGCTPDPKTEAIQKAVEDAIGAYEPTLIGVQFGDVGAALKAADGDTVIVPVRLPQLDPGTKVEAVSEVGSADTSVEDAADAATASALTAWMEWYRDNTGSVDHVEVDLPVTFTMVEDEPNATVDEKQLRELTTKIAAANAPVVLATALTTSIWQNTMVFERASSFVPGMTGLTDAAVKLAKIESLDPLEQEGQFNVKVKYPELSAVFAAQATKLAGSFGTGKIWGLSETDFANRMSAVEVDASSVPPTATAEGTITLKRDDRAYDPDKDLKANLMLEASRYSVTRDGGSSGPSDAEITQLRAKAAADAYSKLKTRVVQPQKRPGTSKLLGGKSGSPVVLKTGGGGDRHITFFKWGSSKQVVSLFVKSGKSISVRVPVGSYRMVYATGATWYGRTYSFGPSGSYSEFKTSGSSAMKIKIKSNYRYTISIAVSSGDAGSRVPSGSTSNPYAK